MSATRGALIRYWLRQCLPPFLIDVYRKWARRGIRFVGPYPDWERARAVSLGYDADLILEKVSAAQDKVISGEAAYERDSVLFEKIDYPFPLLAGLLRAASEGDGSLNVIDFGGSLGSTYFQCKEFLGDIKQLNWHVVEQEKFVVRGRERFESERLRFFSTIAESRKSLSPNVVLFCSVLQYIEAAEKCLTDAVDTGCTYLIIDRTPMSVLTEDVLCVQHVPPEVYAASYPCAILSESKLRVLLSGHFELLADFDALGGEGRIEGGKTQIPFLYKGMIWRRRQHESNEFI